MKSPLGWIGWTHGLARIRHSFNSYKVVCIECIRWPPQQPKWWLGFCPWKRVHKWPPHHRRTCLQPLSSWKAKYPDRVRLPDRAKRSLRAGWSEDVVSKSVLPLSASRVLGTPCAPYLTFKGGVQPPHLKFHNLFLVFCKNIKWMIWHSIMSSSISPRPEKLTGGCLCGAVRYAINITEDLDWPPTKVDS